MELSIHLFSNYNPLYLQELLACASFVPSPEKKSCGRASGLVESSPPSNKQNMRPPQYQSKGPQSNLSTLTLKEREHLKRTPPTPRGLSLRLLVVNVCFW